MIIYTKIKPFPTVCACPSCHMQMDDKCYLIFCFPTPNQPLFLHYMFLLNMLYSSNCRSVKMPKE